MTKKKDIAKKIILPAAIAASGILCFSALHGQSEKTYQGRVIEVMASMPAYDEADGVCQPENEEVPDIEVIGEKIAIYPEYDFIRREQKAYLIKDTVLKCEPYIDAGGSDSLKKYDEIILTGTNNMIYWEVNHNGSVCYIEQSAITTDKSVIVKMKDKERQERIARRKAKKEAEKKAALEAREKRIEKEHPVKWNGSKLTSLKGVNMGPSGKETYYNLPMGGVIRIMRSMGNKDKYWVRKDGCKMLGDYIMVAANLKLRPRGSLVKTSLGMAIVCDTGTFAKKNPRQLDIAVNW